MQRFFKNLAYVNKPMVYGGFKNLFQNQQVAGITSLQLNKYPLPKQPVPDLDKTAQLYLKSVQPLLNNEEFENTKKVLTEFLKDGGIGRQLYKKLQERYETTDNWMSDWWLEVAYLGYRYPVIVHSSPGAVGPSLKFTSKDDFYKGASHLVSAVCNYNNMIKSNKIKQEMIRDQPLDMQSYAVILGTHRRPNKPIDNLLHTDNSDHIIIISNNHFFKLSLTLEINEEALAASIKDIAQRSEAQGNPVGILTGNDRDSWAEDHKRLKSLGANNEILKDIEDALFVLCLDKELPKEYLSNKNELSVRAVQCLTGLSIPANAANRWHDKIVQYILSYDGFIGIQYEHSPCEALPVTVLHDYVIDYIKKKQSQSINIPSDFPRAKNLQFELDQVLEKSIQRAAQVVEKLSQNMDMECFRFDEFGANDIKQLKMSPDSFIQIAMQAAFYKLHKKPPAHYESAALRRFNRARTECIRSTSNESVNFAKLMVDKNASINTKKTAMVTAINAHKKLATEATMGAGVDRLFFGLKMIAKEKQIELPSFFADVSYLRSTSFTLTSSQVAFKTDSFMCYGPVDPDGYGCCYNPKPNYMIFACSSFKDSINTCTKEFAAELRLSLRNMKKLAEA